jgi:hypothetical protein
VHYLFLLVHSLWGRLWKQKKFDWQMGSDLRKRQNRLVDENLFCRSFIHSFLVGRGESRVCVQRNDRKIWPRRNGFRMNGHFLRCFTASFVKEREYAVDNAHLA